MPHPDPNSEIARTVRLTRIISADLLHELCAQDLSKSRAVTALTVLTDREREIVALIAKGRSTKEQAVDLYISVKTAETHRRNAMEKLNLTSTAEVTRYAIREGLAALGD